MQFIIPLLAVLLLIAPLYFIYRRKIQGKSVQGSLYIQIGAFFAFLVLASLTGIGNTALAAEPAVSASHDFGLGLIAAALATGLSGIGGGIAVSASAAAAIGAISENDKVFGKALLFVALAEGIALYGLLISFQILGRL
jgi:V/A-type H+-transporting ATPase subunit K